MNQKPWPNPYIRPLMKEFLKEKFWAIHEAAFALSGWPEYGLTMITVSGLPKMVSEHRTWFYLPIDDFNPKHYDKSFQKIYSEIKKSIESGSLNAAGACIVPGIAWLLSPKDVLSWAILKGIYFSLELQNASGLHLINYEIDKPFRNSIKNKIIGQFLLYEKPIRSVRELSRDDLIVNFGTGDPNRDPSAIVEDMNALYGTKGERGQKLRPFYHPKPIPEIKLTEDEGIVRYNFPSLRIALETLLNIFLYRKGKGDVLMGANNHINYPHIGPVIDEFISLGIVRLYIDNAPEIIRNLSLMICEGFFSDYGMWSPTYLEQEFKEIQSKFSKDK